MPVYLQHEEPPRPTHDEQRDVSSADEVRFDYDLHSRRGPQPGVKSSYGDTIIGTAKEERNDLITTGKTNVVARSGNQHWDDDGDESFELAGAPAPGVGVEEPPFLPPSVAKVLPWAIAGFVFWKIMKTKW
jgi:hypothetical protein